VEVGNFSPGRAAAVHFRALAGRVWHTAAGGRPGVVHLNFPLREPLAPVAEALDGADWEGRPDGGPWVQLHAPSPAPSPALVDGMAARVRGVTRGAIVAGSAGEGVAQSVASLAAATGWPVLADPLSGLRCGPHDRSHVISHYDVLLRSESWAAAHVPELVLRIGDTPTSKPLRAWLAQASQLVVDPHAVWHEPTRMAETIVQTAAGPLCAAVADAVSADPDQQWLGDWRDADDLVPRALADTPDDFEPRAWLAAVEAAPLGAIVWVASSMPIRDVETFVPSMEKALTFLSNRGANGIDGTVSSAAGAALATGRPVILLIGELALLHDIGGVLAARRAGAELTIVCANNGGGGIFDFLPVAGAADRALYEEHIATPSGVDLERVAALAEMPYANEVTGAPGLIEVRTDRASNVAQHRALFARVAEQLG
jgi:2-succinyl-5-enolpyruvyl-6-hydroxy-3-cyclohexene-1-carboxylate synthase